MNGDLLYTITAYLLLFAGSIMLLFSLLHFIIGTGKFENNNLIILHLVLSIIYFQVAQVLTGFIHTFPEILFGHSTLLYVIIPLSFFAYYVIIFPPEKLPSKKALYFIPAMIVFIFDCLYMALPHTDKSRFVEMFLHGQTSLHASIAGVLLAGAGVMVMLFHGWLLIKFIRLFIQGSRTLLLSICIVSSLVIIAGTEFLVLGYMTGRMFMAAAGAIAVGLLFFISHLIGVKHPNLIKILIIEAREKYSGTLPLRGIDDNSLVREMDTLMRNEEIYRDDELTLNRFAEIIDITPLQLSYVLNVKMGINFNTYVNRYRIEKAKELLVNERDRTVLSIAYDVGFNSKSTFYESFSRFTGMTPREFLISRKH